MRSLGMKLKTLREEKGWSLEQAARKVGNITKQSISAFEKGESTPKVETLIRIARAYNVSLDYLLGDAISAQEEDDAEILPGPALPGDWRQIALALAEATKEYSVAARLRAEADKLAQENLKRALGDADVHETQAAASDDVRGRSEPLAKQPV